MDISITLKAEPKLLKAIDALVECLQAQGVLATSLTTFEPQTGATIEALPETQTQPIPETVPDQLLQTAAVIGSLTRLLFPQATSHAEKDLGPPDTYLAQVKTDFLAARGKTSIKELADPADLDALLYTLQGASAQRAAWEAAQQVAPIQIPQAPVYSPAPTAPVYQAPVQQIAPAPQMAAPVVVPTAAPAYTLNQLSVAGAMLAESGKREEIRSLLGKYGVPALTQLPKEHFGNFAMDLRALGAKI